MPPARKPKLAKLEEQQAALAAQIKELKREERRQNAARERKRYTILGRALAKELAENDSLAAKLEPILNDRVTKPRERDLLGLPPMESKSPPVAGQ